MSHDAIRNNIAEHLDIERFVKEIKCAGKVAALRTGECSHDDDLTRRHAFTDQLGEQLMTVEHRHHYIHEDAGRSMFAIETEADGAIVGANRAQIATAERDDAEIPDCNVILHHQDGRHATVRCKHEAALSIDR